ncbi:MAG: hypothetical protein D6772_16145 [Bacteroidetes bacterium]|nr:MAG: hypothetical protein D6772_16145 [Bacteroidota bacterium]
MHYYLLCALFGLLPAAANASPMVPPLVSDSTRVVYFFDYLELSPDEFMNYRAADHPKKAGRRLG